jgi:hypothetical protein
VDTLRHFLLQGVPGVATRAVFPGSPAFVVAQPHQGTAVNEEFLAASDAAIKNCWQLYYSGDSSFVEQFLPTFLAQLVSLPQQPLKYHKRLVETHAIPGWRKSSGQ